MDIILFNHAILLSSFVQTRKSIQLLSKCKKTNWLQIMTLKKSNNCSKDRSSFLLLTITSEITCLTPIMMINSWNWAFLSFSTRLPTLKSVNSFKCTNSSRTYFKATSKPTQTKANFQQYSGTTHHTSNNSNLDTIKAVLKTMISRVNKKFSRIWPSSGHVIATIEGTV